LGESVKFIQEKRFLWLILTDWSLLFTGIIKNTGDLNKVTIRGGSPPTAAI
jgi:hypothetical protein